MHRNSGAGILFSFSHDKSEMNALNHYRRGTLPHRDVHSVAAILKNKRQRKPGTKYIGARTAEVLHSRHCWGRGHKLLVYHLPENGDRAHSLWPFSQRMAFCKEYKDN